MENERSFGQVHFAGDGLHGAGVERIGVEHDRARVTLQGLGGEGVNLEEGVGGHRFCLFVVRHASAVFSHSCSARTDVRDYEPAL